MRNRMTEFAHDADGQDLVEYAMLASLIALVAIAGMTLIGGRLVALFNAVAGAL